MTMHQIFSPFIRGTVALATIFASASVFALNYDVQYTSTPPSIDGTIDTAWASASPAASGFVDMNTVATVSAQQTSVRMLWDQTKLYVLCEAVDDAIVAPATAKDTGFSFTTQDALSLLFDPTYNQTTGKNDMIYHIAVNPSASAYTYTEAGQGQMGWDLGSGSQVAFAQNGTNWIVEMAIPFTDFNSTLTNSPGIIIGAPGNGSMWGTQLGRYHSTGNNATVTKWHPTTGSSLSLRTRPFGTVTFKNGPTATGMNLSAYDPLYTTGFEAPTFTAGQSIYGIEDWLTSFPLSFTATTAEFKSGTQSMEMITTSGGHTITGKDTIASKGTIWLQYACKLSPETTYTTSGYRHVLYLTGRYANGGTDTLSSVWFLSRTAASTAGQGGNSIQINSFETTGSEATATSVYFPGITTLGEWGYLTVKINEIDKTFQVWYNGRKLALPGRSDTYGVKNKSTFQRFLRTPLYTTNNGGTISSFFDDYAIHTEYTATAVSKEWSLYE